MEPGGRLKGWMDESIVCASVRSCACCTDMVLQVLWLRFVWLEGCDCQANLVRPEGRWDRTGSGSVA